MFTDAEVLNAMAQLVERQLIRREFENLCPGHATSALDDVELKTLLAGMSSSDISKISRIRPKQVGIENILWSVIQEIFLELVYTPSGTM